MHRVVPWLLVGGLLLWITLSRGSYGLAVERANVAEDSIAALEPVVSRLLAQARERDTLLVHVTDTIEVIVERVRERTVVLTDSVLAHTDSIGAVYVAELQDAHAEEVTALEQLAQERLLWGTAWRDAALAYEAQTEQYRIANRGLNDALRASRRQASWLKVGGLALVGLAAYNALGPS